MKISIIGAGNVGSTTALRLAQEGAGNIVLVDVVKGLAQGKAFDLEDARSLVKIDYKIEGLDDISAIKNSDIIVITAGLPRKPGMTREELLAKNAQILKGICDDVKRLSADAVVIIVTNPLDVMTYFALKVTGMDPKKIFGMGVSLDAARFANLISKELAVATSEIDACVIGSHGEGMFPLPRYTTVKGVALDELMDDKKIESLVQKTIGRGAKIVYLLGQGSAYYAPSAAITSLVKAIAKDEKRTIGVCAYLDGEYGIKDICIGVPCRLGKKGIEKIIELDLNKEEKEVFTESADSIRKNIVFLGQFFS